MHIRSLLLCHYPELILFPGMFRKLVLLLTSDEMETNSGEPVVASISGWLGGRRTKSIIFQRCLQYERLYRRCEHASLTWSDVLARMTA
jgi:hypothetical protein